MSTHCGIAIKDEEGYKVIYCHHDGYPDYMYNMLTENYNSEELARRLVGMGDASFIAEKLETDQPHSFNKPQHDTCCFYHRDRGEDWNDVAPELYKHHERRRLLNCWYYLYIFEEGCWHFYKDSEEIY